MMRVSGILSSGFVLLLLLCTAVRGKRQRATKEVEEEIEIGDEEISIHSLLHQIRYDRPFTTRASFTITETTSKTTAKFLDSGRIEKDEIQDFMKLIESNGFYKIAVRSAEDDSASPLIVTSIPACQLFLGGFKEKIVIRRNENGDIASLEYANPFFPGDCGAKRFARAAGKSKSGSIRIKSAGIVVSAEDAPQLPAIINGNLFIKGAEKLGKKDEGLAEEQKPKSIFARYWHIILPVGIMMLVSRLNPPPEAAGGAGGSG
eukprot:g5185.t1